MALWMVVLLVLPWLGLPCVDPLPPLLGALWPIPSGVGVIPDCFFWMPDLAVCLLVLHDTGT